MLRGVPPPQEPGKNQDPLGVDGATELYLPFDVHDFTPAEAHRGSDPTGPPEGVITQLKDRQAVDLPHLGACRVDEDGLPVNLFLDPVLEAACSIDPVLNGLDDVVPADPLAPFLACPVVTLLEDIQDTPGTNGQLLPVFRHPGAVFDDPGHRLPLEGSQACCLDLAGDETGVESFALLVPIHPVIEVRLDLEELGEIGIVGSQEIVDHAAAQEHDFHVQGHRLGLQGHGAHHPQHLPGRFDM